MYNTAAGIIKQLDSNDRRGLLFNHFAYTELCDAVRMHGASTCLNEYSTEQLLEELEERTNELKFDSFKFEDFEGLLRDHMSRRNTTWCDYADTKEDFDMEVRETWDGFELYDEWNHEQQYNTIMYAIRDRF